ncbi:hypothetical protein IFM89_024414 [Coptis chinensis]|uniref:RNase H type-1 domain-containing protein n=1 Tax=Coptis chinensis TaxID=261450 RepID=A0A835IFD6_9MAGN|nr:hypothetical protein IFM89_024414 [Coptis chinensis]
MSLPLSQNSHAKAAWNAILPTDAKTKLDEDIIAKLNTDGGVNGRGSRSGGIIRNNNGDTIVAYVGSSLNNFVIFQELYAIHQCLLMCLQLNTLKVTVASDSLRAIQAINKIEAPPWQMVDMVVSIQKLSLNFVFVEFKHAFREINRAVDHLASLADPRDR